MSKILVASTPTPGHVHPMLHIAAAFKERGHEVLFLTADSFRQKVEACGIRYVSLRGRANWDWQNLDALLTEQEARAKGLKKHIVHLQRVFADCIPDQAELLEETIWTQKIDLVLTEVSYLGVLPLLLRGRQRPPVFCCGVCAPMWRDAGNSPLRGPDASVEGQKRNIADGLLFDEAIRGGTDYIGQVLERLGVKAPGGSWSFDVMYRVPDRLMQLSVEEFEYPLVEHRDNLRFVGPIRYPSQKPTHSPAWANDQNNERPLVFVTQGTSANTDFDQLVNTSIRALANEPVRVVATAGSGDMGRILRASNTLIESYIPYEQILPMTSVFITNGGYNGVQTALSFGVPIISGGSTEDKPFVSARVEWSGVGIDLKTGNPSEEEIRVAVRKIISQSEYRARAQWMAECIRMSNAPSTIVTEAEALLKRRAFS